MMNKEEKIIVREVLYTVGNNPQLFEKVSLIMDLNEDYLAQILVKAINQNYDEINDEEDLRLPRNIDPMPESNGEELPQSL